jgi:hypothetical protein
MLRLHWLSRHGYPSRRDRHCHPTEPPAWTAAGALAENWLSVKCAYEYVCAQYGMYLYVFCEYLFVSVCIDKLQKNWLSVKCEYVYVCLQYGMYLYILSAYHVVYACISDCL